MTTVDFSVPLMYHDPSDPGSLILIQITQKTHPRLPNHDSSSSQRSLNDCVTVTQLTQSSLNGWTGYVTRRTGGSSCCQHTFPYYSSHWSVLFLLLFLFLVCSVRKCYVREGTLLLQSLTILCVSNKLSSCVFLALLHLLAFILCHKWVGC